MSAVWSPPLLDYRLAAFLRVTGSSAEPRIGSNESHSRLNPVEGDVLFVRGAIAGLHREPGGVHGDCDEVARWRTWVDVGLCGVRLVACALHRDSDRADAGAAMGDRRQPQHGATRV